MKSIKCPAILEHLSLSCLHYQGDCSLLEHRKIAIVGTRRPNTYTQSCVQEIAAKIAPYAVVVSGGALGVDILAHVSALPKTIFVAASSLDVCYPKSHEKIFQKIYQQGLALSQYAPTYHPRGYSFLERNKIIISLSEFVIIPQADLQSGSLFSARYAKSLGKKIYVLPHRLRESLGTQEMIKKGEAEVIWDIDAFVAQHLNGQMVLPCDELLAFCQTQPLFHEVVERFGERVYEYELEGKIIRRNGRVEVIWRGA